MEEKWITFLRLFLALPSKKNAEVKKFSKIDLACIFDAVYQDLAPAEERW